MNLIFLCPVKKAPVGGIKVIYRLAEVISSILPAEHECIVLHPNRPFFRPLWFNFSVKRRRQFFGLRWNKKPSFSNIKNVFDPESDIVVLPEIWVHKYAEQLLEGGIPYIIFVQGSYLLSRGNRKELLHAYQNSLAIISVSDNCTKCLQSAFPIESGKIFRVTPCVNSKKFSEKIKKEKIITYMPRKLSDHFRLLKFFLGDRLSSEWRFLPIDGYSEDEVTHLLQKSQIFLSFSYLEGLGLPPIEAAIAGNYVLGYTGEGGKEFWYSPLFTEIYHGDILDFSEKLVNLTRMIDALSAPDVSAYREQIVEKFSEKSQIKDVFLLLKNLKLIPPSGDIPDGLYN